MSGYFDNIRTDVLPFLPEGGGYRVLELGCGEGRTGEYLLNRGLADEVIGVEFDETSAESARSRLSRVFQADLNQFEDFGDGFDLVLALDVIEHLVDPWEVVDRVVERMVPGGVLVTSTPNLRYWRILFDLGVRGRWEYAESGIMDRTHLRFFTRTSIVDLHQRAGLQVEEVGYPELSGKRQILSKLMRGSGDDLLSGQHVVRSRKK